MPGASVVLLNSGEDDFFCSRRSRAISAAFAKPSSLTTALIDWRDRKLAVFGAADAMFSGPLHLSDRSLAAGERSSRSDSSVQQQLGLVVDSSAVCPAIAFVSARFFARLADFSARAVASAAILSAMLFLSLYKEAYSCSSALSPLASSSSSQPMELNSPADGIPEGAPSGVERGPETVSIAVSCALPSRVCE